ncbi:MAG TPA: MBL fold metallo-hydrolase [Polyangiaceae bacterium]|nr:MBL fold metallo-hydrolase [Polyangiaceae bacterium]
MCPFGGRLWDGKSPLLGPAELICHCLLVETKVGLVLVDTGLGSRDVAAPGARLSPLWAKALRVRPRPAQTAIAQVRALGYGPRDVRHVVLTHLDVDHAGGIDDFPWAAVHLFAPEYRAAQERDTFLARRRYRPPEWQDEGRFRVYEAEGEPWFGFECVRGLAGLPPEIVLVPLVGHTRGHAGVAIERGGGHWLLHAGDAYFDRGELLDEPRRAPGLGLYQWLMQADGPARRQNQARLRELVHSRSDVAVLSSHDAFEFERCRRGAQALGRTARVAVAGAGAY